MVFSSLLFLFVFLPVFILVYHLVGFRYKNIVILLASVVFYGWGAPKFIFMVLGSLVVNFYVVKKLYKSNLYKQYYLFLSLVINIGLLLYFKYANFFIENTNFILESININAINWTRIALPIGISFFTFQSITYTVDVYRNVHKPLNKISDYLLYILMFPQLIAGPIVRFNTIADDIIDRRKNETIDNKLMGICRFAIGLSKKVLIANVLGEQVDMIYGSPMSEIDTSLAWIAIIAYSFQIYFDFSGYSDMAIGLGKIIGFNFPENFNNPYVSRSISEFWRRWHITLGAWMKDYLYIPLGGNRVKTKFRLFFNLGFVFIISGLWHGASWNFIIWGAWHGIFLILDRIFLLNVLNKIGKVPAIIFTYFIVLIGWVFFRIEELDKSVLYLRKMFSLDFSQPSLPLTKEFWTIFMLAALFSFITISKFGLHIEKKVYQTRPALNSQITLFIISFILFVLSTSYIASSGFNPFIYFRF